MQPYKITLDDYEKINKSLKEMPNRVSELSFANFFMWRGYYNFSFFTSQGCLYVISEGSEHCKPFAFFPLLDEHALQAPLEEILHPIQELFQRRGWTLRFSRLTMSQAKALCDIQQKDSPIEILTDPDNDDYIYATNDLISLCGKKYSKKRNHINKFLSLYQYEYQPLCAENFTAAQNFLEYIYQNRAAGSLEQKAADLELLFHYKELGCEGALIFVDGKVCACTIGELLTPDTAVIHLEKADCNIEGVYAACNQMFCENQWKNTTYINREQDLGIAGLRKSKKSYFPVKMGEKYYVVF